MTSLRDQIKSAKTTKQLNLYMQTGERYEYASPKTRRRWKRAAEEVSATIKK